MKPISFIFYFLKKIYIILFSCLNSDFCLIPIQARDFDITESPLCEQIFYALEFRPPGLGEWMWRIPGYFTISDIDTLFEKFKLSLENGVENVDEGKTVMFTERTHNMMNMERNEQNLEDEEASFNGENEEIKENENEEIKEDEDENEGVDFNDLNDNYNDSNSVKSVIEDENVQNEIQDDEGKSIQNEVQDDEGENYFDENEDAPPKIQKNTIEPTLALATLDDDALQDDENNKGSKSKSKKWEDATLPLPTLNPE